MRLFFVSILLFLFLPVLKAQYTYDRLMVDYDNAWQYKNLRLIPIRPKGLPGNAAQIAQMVPLREAMEKGYIRVEERGTASIENVHYLSLYNNSDKTVYINSGELLQGGRQDRMVSKDTVVLPKSGRMDLPVMCVEEGRWSEKTKPFIHHGSANPALRKVLDVGRNQVLIWKEIDNQLTRDSINSKSLAYLARRTDKKYSADQLGYLDYFRKQLNASDSNIVGVVAISGDQVLGTEMYLTRDLFFAESEAVIAGYAEQVAMRGKAPALTNEQVRKYMDNLMGSQSRQDAYLEKNGKKFVWQGKTIHITSY